MLDVETDDVIQRRDVRRRVSYIMGISEAQQAGSPAGAEWPELAQEGA